MEIIALSSIQRMHLIAPAAAVIHDLTGDFEGDIAGVFNYIVIQHVLVFTFIVCMNFVVLLTILI